MENSIFQLADKLKEIRDKKKALEEEVKAINSEYEFTEVQLSEVMVQEEMQNFKRSGIVFYLNTKTHASAIAERKDQLFETLRSEGYGDLIHETVNANSLSAFAKEQIIENEDVIPDWLDGLIHIYEKTSVGMRKG